MGGGDGAWVVAVDCGTSALRIPSTNTRSRQSPGVLVQNEILSHPLGDSDSVGLGY